MMEDYIQISKLNDFVFCPYSIYLHSVYESFSQRTYHRAAQTVGKIAHEPVDKKIYTTSADVLQGREVCCERLGIMGKIDTFDVRSGLLVERKYKVKKIFDGYRYQLYAQMFCLREMGYVVKSLAIHSLSDNKRYKISLPDGAETLEFEKLIEDMQNYKAEPPLHKNPIKCAQCVYKPLCG
jgi:CRISPR-associated protein Cas4